MKDIIIVGGGASGLFCSMNAPKDANKLILEKNDSLGKKILLSGGGRGNLTNIDLDPERDYFGLNLKFLHSVFHKFSNHDFIEFLSSNSIETKQENHGKIFLKDHNTSKFVDFLTKKVKDNNTDIELKIEIYNIIKDQDLFKIKTNKGEFQTKKLVISTGGKCYPQVGASGFAYDVAKQFDMKVIKTWKGMCPIVVEDNISILAGTTVDLQLEFFDKNKLVFSGIGSCLFTHDGISGPVVYDSILNIGQYLRKIKIDISNDEQYIRQNIIAKIKFNLDNVSKKLIIFFNLNEKNDTVILNLKGLGSWKQSQITGGGISLRDISPNFESRKVPGLYFLGEALDVTGRTGGYNLQFARSSGYVCGINLI